jgi:hypothetical protein
VITLRVGANSTDVFSFTEVLTDSTALGQRFELDDRFAKYFQVFIRKTQKIKSQSVRAFLTDTG